MPDDVVNTPSQTSEPATQSGLQEQEKPSELEQLISEAEASAQRDPIASTSPQRPQTPQTKCSHEMTFPSERAHCRTCGRLICPLCWSVLDPGFCKDCLSDKDTALIQEPLKDADGVTHEGRVLHPDPQARFYQPRFGTLAKTISEMTENELETYIKHYKDLVVQAERALDFRRIVLGSAQLEQAQRNDANRRKLRQDKTKYPVKTLSVSANGTKKKTASTEDLLRMMEMLKQLQINRDAKAKAEKK